MLLDFDDEQVKHNQVYYLLFASFPVVFFPLKM